MSEASPRQFSNESDPCWSNRCAREIGKGVEPAETGFAEERQEEFCPKKNAAEFRGGFRGPSKSPELKPRGLREDDLDAAVLRLAYAWCRWNTGVVHAAAGDDHVAAGYAKPFERDCHRIGPPFGEPLVVARRARQVGIAGDLQLHATARFVLVRREHKDLLPLRRDVVLIPVEEHEVDLMYRRRRGRRRCWWRRCRRRTKLHCQAGHDIVGAVPRADLETGYHVCALTPAGEWEHALVVIGRVRRREVAIIDVKCEQRVDIVTETRNPLIAELPGAAVLEQRSAKTLRRDKHWSGR